MARCSSSTTCSASTTATHRASPSATPMSRRRWSPAWPNTPPRSAAGASPAPSTRIRSRKESWRVYTPGSPPEYHGVMGRLGQVFAPRDRIYFELFDEAGQNVQKAAELLDRPRPDYPDHRELADEIRECEHEGDRIVHDIHRHLNQTLVTPIDRADLLALASAL